MEKLEYNRYIDILNQSENGFLGKKEDLIQMKLIALDSIAENCNISMIYHVLGQLKSNSKLIQQKSMGTIVLLNQKMTNLIEIQNSFRNCQFKKEDFDWYESNFEESHYKLLLKIASVNRNGFIREFAIEQLGSFKNKEIIPYLILRIGDWVPIIAFKAKLELQKYLIPSNLKCIISHIELIDGHRKLRRVDLSLDIKIIMDFILIENKIETYKCLKYFSDKQRLVLAKEIAINPISISDLDVLINDKNFLVRLLVLNHFEKLSDFQKNKLLNDKSARIREKTLLCYRGTSGFETKLKLCLEDRSGVVRNISRYYLKDKSIDFKTYYLDNLKKNYSVQGSMLGLADLDAVDSVDSIKPFLFDDKINVVKTAFYVIEKLDPYELHDYAINNLKSNQIGIKVKILKYFGNHPSKGIIKLVQEYYTKSDVSDKLYFLKLFNAIGGYSVFPDLLKATIDENEEIRKQSKVYLDNWRDKTSSLYMLPTSEEKEIAFECIKLVNTIHQEKDYFSCNPTKGLEFFFR